MFLLRRDQMAVRKNRFAQISTCFVNGTDGVQALMEISILPGLPSVEIVGLCDSSVRESRERVRAAIRQIGFDFPSARITVGIFPAYIHKSGSSFDLPLALGILIASGQIRMSDSRPVIAFGELTLTGRIRETPGTIAKLSAIDRTGSSWILIPSANRREADLLGLSVSHVCCLNKAVRILTGSNDRSCACDVSGDREQRVSIVDEGEVKNDEEGHNADPMSACKFSGRDTSLDSIMDFSCLKGQEKASRAILLAAAGMHNILLSGSPGSGKTTAARVLRGILPPLSQEEKIDYLRTVSLSRVLEDNEIDGNYRPFRYVHHSCTTGRLIGNPAGNIPGELALSLNGILFLDEMAEFSPRVLDMLRQPLENKCENRFASQNSSVFPSRFLLIGAMNPCRCGKLLDSPSSCSCTVAQRRQYDKRISGPILDRIDIFCELYRLRRQGLFDSVAQGSASESGRIREEIKECWEIQFERCNEFGINPVLNGEADGFQINELFRIQKDVLEQAVLSAERLSVSARGLSKILRVARTAADLEGERDMQVCHVSEAFQFRNRRDVTITTFPAACFMSKYKGGRV